MVTIQIIIGSTRQGRFSEKPAHYIFDELKKRANVEAELIDLRDWPLPFFDEPTSPASNKGNYVNEIGKRWAAKIGEADGYIMVTPEYNHGYSAVLKNAIDWVFPEWKNKPVGFVSYGNMGGARAIEQLRQVVIELQMLPIRNAIHIPGEVYLAMIHEKAPVNPEFFKPLREGRQGRSGRDVFQRINHVGHKNERDENMNQYVPGECNIGAEEIARRLNVGWVSLAITIIVLAALLLTGVDRWWRVVLFFPAAMSASGFLQAYFHFCSGFARKGVFNFGPIGQTTSIEDELSKKKDNRKGFQIILFSALLGATAAVLGVLFR